MAFEKPYIIVVGEAHLTNIVLNIVQALLLKYFRDSGDSKSFTDTKNHLIKNLGENIVKDIEDQSKIMTLEMFDKRLIQAGIILDSECNIVETIQPDIILLERPAEEEAICEKFNERKISAEELANSLYNLNDAIISLDSYGVNLQNALKGSEIRLRNIKVTLNNYRIGFAKMLSVRDDVRVHAIDMSTERRKTASNKEREDYMAMRTVEIADAEQPQTILMIVGFDHTANIENLLMQKYSYEEDHINDMPLLGAPKVEE